MKLLLLLGVAITLAICHARVGCLNRDGEPVDWWFMSKIGNGVAGEHSGSKTLYFDESQPTTPHIGNITQNTALKQTVTQLNLYTGNPPRNDTMYMVWNDQTYTSFENAIAGKMSSHSSHHGDKTAHAKGMLAVGTDSAFLISHSSPGFPLSHDIAPSEWMFMTHQMTYGQHFFCVNVDVSAVEDLTALMQYNNYWIYDTYVPDSLRSQFPNAAALAGGAFKRGSGYLKLKSKEGADLIAFAKNGDNGIDLFEDMIAPTLSDNLTVMCWCEGHFGYHCQPQDCKGEPIVEPSVPQQGHDTYDFSVVNVLNITISGMEWHVANEHSKWAVTQRKRWFCPSDINREYSQRKRGGGSICIHNTDIWKTISHAVTYKKQCP